MQKTIKYERKCDWWDGKVLIDEIKEYADDRGMVAETYRSDDIDGIKTEMCYISETNPFVLRGPHEHHAQKDSFVTWKSRMIYQMYNKDTKETKWFVTDPTKITRVIVAVGIVHSYRNISLETVKTLNFPDQLFMGVDKKGWSETEKIDEIRHEESIKPTKTIWVLGANGRLGNALVNSLFANMGYHSYHVIPIYNKFDNNSAGMKDLNFVLDNILKEKSENDIIINTIAKTNVQDVNGCFTFSNFLLPKYLTEFAIKHNIKLLHFSTDYVYQMGKVSEYTKSKKQWEEWFNSLILKNSFETSQEDVEADNVKIIRLANLFSLDIKDTHNVLNKVYNKFIEQELSVPEHLIIMPTNCEILAKWIADEYIPTFDTQKQFVNVSGKPYNFKELYEMSGLKTEFNINIIENPETINNPSIFLENPSYVELNCDVAIKRKFDTIINTK